MKIDIAVGDIFRLRCMVKEQHDRIENYPVMKSQNPDFAGTIAGARDDQAILRRLYRKLTTASKKAGTPIYVDEYMMQK